MPSRVLVIDDDDLSREIFALLLNSAGYEVDTAESGDAALHHLRTAHPPPEVVLADLQMPGIAGRELALQLRALCGPATLLLAMSASQPDDGSDGEFQGLLLKPFTAETFTKILTAGTTGIERKTAAPNVVLDEAVHRKLAESMRPAQLERLYELCLSDAEKRYNNMCSAASEGDEDTYKKEAHAVKGSCGMVGARELQTLATSIEKHGFSDDHVASLGEFIVACERLRGMLIAREIIDKNRVNGVSGEDA